MLNNILVLCTGNICRSPIVEAVIANGLAADPTKYVWSAGIGALVGRGAHSNSKTVSSAHDVDLQSHVAQQLNALMVDKADVILVMDDGHLGYMRAKYPQASGKTFLLGRWSDNAQVPDPIGKELPEFEKTWEIVQPLCKDWIKRLA
jgi:protein-tyrosine phosphatase